MKFLRQIKFSIIKLHTKKMRKLSNLLIILTLSFVFIYLIKLIVFRSLTMIFESNNRLMLSPSEFTLNSLREISPEEVKRYIIITAARSGSSFFGDFLQQSWPTYYVYEPLISMRVKHPRNDPRKAQNATQLLSELLMCNFANMNDTFLKPIYWNLPYLKWNLMLKKHILEMQRNDITEIEDIDSSYQWFNATLHYHLCRRAKHIVLKTIRFGAEYYANLTQNIMELNLEKPYLILLVRDPRGVMSSRNIINWCVNNPNCTDTDYLCSQMRRDITAVKAYGHWSPEHVTLVRYEDLALDPSNTAKRLFPALDLPLTVSVENWIKRHTIEKDFLSNPHSTIRKSKRAAFSWVNRLDADEILEIQDLCGDVMHQLGYKLVNGQSELIHEIFDDPENERNLDSLNKSDFVYDNFPLDYLRP